MEKLTLAGRSVGPNEPPYIVAEIGSNHNGDMALCTRLIDAARDCGVDAVKVQSWSRNSLISEAEYRRNRKYGAGDKQLPSLEEAVLQYQLSAEQHREISRYCREKKVTFFSSVFSKCEVDLMELLETPAYKIASMDVNNPTLLEYVAGTHKPVVLSTGLATLGEIEGALNALVRGGCRDVVLLHCVSLYPSPPDTIHLRNIETLHRVFDVPVGYSDHSLGTSIPLASIAFGACLIEKHFTLDKNLEGWDHAISSDPPEMQYLVRESRGVFEALGSPRRIVTEEQLEKRKSFRRRLVVVRSMKRGERLTMADVDFKRPGTGIRPDEMQYVIGRELRKDVAAQEEIEWSDLL